MPKLSVNPSSIRVVAIVVTYNRLALLQECLAALKAQSISLTTIHVIDNASSDGTQEWFGQAQTSKDFSNLQYHRLSENLGGAAGFEYGLKKVDLEQTDWIWIMDDDSIADPDALAKALHSEAAQQSQTAVIASQVINTEGQLINIPAMFDWSFGKTHPITHSTTSYSQTEMKVDATTFVGFLVRNAVVKQVGYPRGDYFIQSDDFEYSLRIRRAGYDIVLVSDSQILHKVTVIKQTDHNNYIKPGELWKYYYLLRNEILSLAPYLPNALARWRFYVWHIYRATKSSITILLKYDHKWLRLGVEWQAVKDGITQRSGKTINPATFKERVSAKP